MLKDQQKFMNITLSTRAADLAMFPLLGTTLGAHFCNQPNEKYHENWIQLSMLMRHL
jgi:hypothetical protein